MAADAGVTAPAVYRHFAGKEALLSATIASGLDLVEAAAGGVAGGPLADVVGAVADVGLQRPDLWVLLQRELRYLGEEHRRMLRAQLDRVVATLADRLLAERPSLSRDLARMLVAGATSVLSTPSLFRITAPRALQRRELVASAVAVLDTTPSGGGSRRFAAAAPLPVAGDDRRSQLLHHAIRLFDDRGYMAVTLDDIGASVGIAGPSVYHHFATKLDLLVATFDQAVDLLRAGRAEVGGTLADMVGWYVGACLRNRALVGVYVSESGNLPADVRHRVSGFLRDLILQWSASLRRLDATLSPPAARLRVQAAVTLIADLARLGQFHRRPGISEDLRSMALAVLVQQRPLPP